MSPFVSIVVMLPCLWAASAVVADLPPIPAGAVNAGAQVVTRYGSEYVVIPGGNRPFFGTDHLSNPFYAGTTFDGGGSVPYSFGIARTETTIAQWTEFANAYAPFWQGSPSDPRFLGFNIARDVTGQFYHDPRVAQTPVSGVSWLAAASYCNWLCNNQRLDRGAFETGAYDLRGINIAAMSPRSTPIVQDLHAPFRLPTVDEWYKAGFYDPNRLGPAAGGWWLYPNGLDRPLVPGLPGEDCETNAGVGSQVPFGEFIDVASYSGQSPWGLFDVSGGVAEYTTSSGRIVPTLGEFTYTLVS